MSNLNELKKNVFFEFLNIAGRVFIIVNYSPDVIIGKRGFTDEERENGIILVFNSRMNFIWDERGINTNLVFGNSAHKCFIPADDISVIYSPELNAQFVVGQQPEAEESEQKQDDEKLLASEEESKKVIVVDFKKKRKKDE